MTYKPKTTLRGPWPTTEQFADSASASTLRVPRVPLPPGENATKTKIKEYLRAFSCATIKQLTDAVSSNKSTTASAVRSLLEDNQVGWKILLSDDRMRKTRHYFIRREI